MTRILRAVPLAAALALAAPAPAQEIGEWSVSAGVPLASFSGSTMYRISASDGASSIKSELEFPVTGYLAGARVQAARRISSWQRWVLEGNGMHSLTEPKGTMEDSDWIEGPIELLPVAEGGFGLTAPNPGKDIYSTSQVQVRALALEARVGLELEPAPFARVTPLAGILYQRFDYVARQTVQVGYGSYGPDFTGTHWDRSLEYDVSYQALYVGGRGEVGRGPVSAALEAWVSPIASASDRDDHLLRQKLSETEADGWAWYAGVEGRLALGASDALAAHASIVRFETSGTQTQRFYGGENAGLTGTIGAVVRSTRGSLALAWTHGF